MKLNAKSEYAMRLMLDLASRPGGQTTLEEIACRQHMPATMLPNIVQTLGRAGLVGTVRGYGGGVRLGRPAKEISVRMVVEAIEGPTQLYRCESMKGPCPLGLDRHCPLRALWEKTQAAMLDIWAATSLADLAKPKPLRVDEKHRLLRTAATQPRGAKIQLKEVISHG